jgi:GAF domain-containing protein
MALHTALCFMLLAVALILSRPAEGFMHLIPRGSIGARSFRRLLPACVLVPLVLGAAQLVGAATGKVNPEAGASLASVATSVVLAILAFFTALSLNRIDSQRRHADLELLARQEQERRAREWALSVGELEELIRAGRDDLPGNAAGIIGMLVGKTGALQGGLYMAETAAGAALRLRVLALYAYDSPQQLERSFGLGEGLAGQCAADRKPLRVDAVPPDYYRLRSTHIDVLPRHLLLLPILLDEEVLGVLELASAEPLEEEVQRFLNSVLRVLAFGIYRYGRMQQARQQGAELERLRARQVLTVL